MRRLALAVLLASTGAAARSDLDTGDDSSRSPLTAVRGRLAGTVATFRVTYTQVLETAGHGIAIELALPTRALVTGATLRRDGVTRNLDLVRAAQAAKQWDALAANDEQLEEKPRGARRSAVLISGSSGFVTASITTPRAGRIELDVGISMQTCFFRDVRYVVLPESWAPHVRGLKVIAKPSEELTLACTSPDGTTEGTWVAFPAPQAARRPTGDRVDAFAGRLIAGEDHIVRVEVDLAGSLADIPRDLATVLVVDASRSMTEEQREAQRELVLSYVRKAKDTRVQVIAYARTARPLLPSWTIASRAAVRVDRELRALAPRNGSNLDVGLADAGAWLAATEGTRRVILVTDERMASRLDGSQAATLKRALPAGTLVHVVSTAGGSDGVHRDDAMPLGSLASATDGMAVRVQKGTDLPIDATMLVRPISIDQVVVTAPGWTQTNPFPGEPMCGVAGDDQLAEGHACIWWGHGDVTSGPIAIAGLVWGTRLSRVVRPDPSQGLELARELSTSMSLDDDLLRRTELMARGVNPQWSLYAEWGGSGRYFEGDGFGIIGGGSCCGGGSFSSLSSTGIGTIGTVRSPPDDLTAQLAPAVAACQLERETARVTFEMTVLEIVDVTVSIEASTQISPNRLRKLTACVEDAIWDASPMIRDPRSHSHHSATFKAS